MKAFGRFRTRTGDSIDPGSNSIADRLYAEMLGIMTNLNRLVIADFDLGALKEHIVTPVARYLSNGAGHYVQPIFVSGKPGIGKTTLLMVLDEALSRLPSSRAASLRAVVASGQIQGYFPDKGALSATPLRLFGKPTAVLSARDWNNVLRHWTFDEDRARESAAALAHFIQQVRGKVVIIDEAELEGYRYFTETLARSGVQVLLTSNLSADFVHLNDVRIVPLDGIDHRTGDLARVCLPRESREWFTLDSQQPPRKSPHLADAEFCAGTVRGYSAVHLAWSALDDRPLLKDDFATFFRACQSQIVLLDGVPFFREIPAADIDLTYLGYLLRFVNFVDAVHDCYLRLVVRSAYPGPIDIPLLQIKLQAALAAYDQRTGDTYGQIAWIEWSRCLSRLKALRPSENEAQ